MTCTRASFHLMNSPSCHTQSQMRGVLTSFFLSPIENMNFDAPLETCYFEMREVFTGLIDTKRYSKVAQLGKVNSRLCRCVQCLDSRVSASYHADAFCFHIIITIAPDFLAGPCFAAGWVCSSVCRSFSAAAGGPEIMKRNERT